MIRNQHLQMQHLKPDTKNQTLPHGVPPWRDTRKKYNIQSNIKMLLGKECKVVNTMKFCISIQDKKKLLDQLTLTK